MQENTQEQALRRRLEIPQEAERVLIFAESSHWDPNWMLTSEEYFDRYVRGNLDQAIEELLREPRRVYSVECMFFLRMYWERAPEQRPRVRELVNSGRLRLTSSGVTTADTLIPRAEAILRDFLLGQEWLRAQGMDQEPKLAYFTDSFGCTPALPSLLRAAGFDRTTITRIDGMHFPGSGFRKPTQTPSVPSNADRLLETERSLDFIWRDSSGAEVLCHWNAFTYGQGDLLAFRGLIRLYHFPTAFADRTDFNLKRRIHKYERQLLPYARTPYMFCPIGFDFVRPIPGLVSLLDRYNRRHYPETGLWVLNAGLDDYLALVDCHRAQLPTMEMDPNPYWTGFYSARPTLKKRSHTLVDELLLAEQLALQSGDRETVTEVPEALREPWWTAAVANHHDFITGTSPDRIVDEEQLPWLEKAVLQARSVVQDLVPDEIPANGQEAPPALPSVEKKAGKLTVNNGACTIDLSGDRGGAILRAQSRSGDRLLLKEPSNEIVSYRDSGGLWRMGYEFRGGTWRQNARSSEGRGVFEVEEQDGLRVLSWTTHVRGRSLRQQMWLSGDSPLLRFQVTGRAPIRHTFTVRFALNLKVSQLVMDTPGGMVVRPPKKVYDPTYWPLHRFIHLVDEATGAGVALFQRYPGAASFSTDGSLEVVALRNAGRERAYRFVPLPGNPAKGREKEDYTFEYALLFTERGDWRENRLPERATRYRRTPLERPRRRALLDRASALFTLDRPDVRVMAAKTASRGEGLILRLYSAAAVGERVRVRAGRGEIAGATLCDARERDLQELDVKDGAATLVMPGTVATLRLLLQQ